MLSSSGASGLVAVHFIRSAAQASRRVRARARGAGTGAAGGPSVAWCPVARLTLTADKHNMSAPRMRQDSDPGLRRQHISGELRGSQGRGFEHRSK